MEKRGSGMGKLWIRDKYPGSATLLFLVIPDTLDPLIVSVQLCVEFVKVGDGSEYDSRPVVGLAVQLLTNQSSHYSLRK
jgi:hypothetical protein